jgi:3-hydroxyisobutyrate dehydrogenase
MGGAMARRLLHAGFDVHVHARNPDRATPFLQAGAVWADSVAALARRCNRVFTIVGGPADVEALYLGEGGLIAHAAPGSCLVDMTTSTPDLARRIASEAAHRGVLVLDAPVTGGAPGAEAGTLTFMVGGEAAALDAVRPMLAAMGHHIFAMGPPGAGQITKASNQLAVAGILLGLAEALHFAESSGIAAARVFDVLRTGTAGGPLMERLGPKMIDGDTTATFAIEHFIKDLSVALDAPDGEGAGLAGAALCRQLYRDLAGDGGGQQGIQALIEHYRNTPVRKSS